MNLQKALKMLRENKQRKNDDKTLYKIIQVFMEKIFKEIGVNWGRYIQVVLKKR